MTYMTEERKMIQQTARDFAVNEVLPIANKLDPVEGEIPWICAPRWPSLATSAF